MLITGVSITVVAPVSDTLTSTVILGMVVVMDSVVRGVERGIVETGTEVMMVEGGREVGSVRIGGISVGAESGAFCFGDGGGVEILVSLGDGGGVGILVVLGEAGGVEILVLLGDRGGVGDLRGVGSLVETRGFSASAS